jgi:hypothetical protein
LKWDVLPTFFMTKLIRISAPHFVCGVVAEAGRIVTAAPIVAYMIGWNGRKFADYCKEKKWKWEKL